MPSISLLVSRLQLDYPAFTFTASQDFHWSPTTKTVHYYGQASNSLPLLLHEVSHGILEHTTYTRDVQLLEMERDAWEHARSVLADRYEVTIESEEVVASLDTYRDWLHSRSTCPACSSSGIQTAKREYKCLACHARWRVNDARTCALRRYHTK